MFQMLTSAKNPRVLAAKALQSKGEREARGLFLAEGEHMVGESLRFGAVDEVFVDADRADEYAALLANVPSEKIFAVPAHVLQAMSSVKTPQGVAATTALPRLRSLDELGRRVVLLENVQDPGNVGTILRTLDAAGFDGCILTTGCADPFSPKVLRATMGSVFRVPMAFAADAPSAARALAESGSAVLATVLDGSDFYAREPLPERVCLIVGNEGAGVTPAARAQATHLFKLPMRGGAESLNAAVAAAIFMYEIVNRT